MRYIHSIVLVRCMLPLAVVCGLLPLPLRGQTPKGRITVECRRLEATADSVYVDFDIRIQSEAVSSGERVRIVPQLKSGDNYLFFPYVEILGHNKARMSDRSHELRGGAFEAIPSYARVRISPTTDTLISYRRSVVCSDWMDKARLVVFQEIENAAGDRRSTVASIGGEVVLKLGEPYRVAPQVAYFIPQVGGCAPSGSKTATPLPAYMQGVPLRKTVRREIRGEAYFDFPAGSAVFSPVYGRNPAELNKISTAFQQIASLPGATITGIWIRGCQSIEGDYSINETLIRDRTLSFRDFLLQKEKITLPGQHIRVQWIAEDWERLETLLVERAHFPSREEILRIIRGVGVFNGREKRLMDLKGGVPYRRMAAELFPLLRRMEYRIEYAEAEDVWRDTPDDVSPVDDGLISARELFLVGQSYGYHSPRFGEMIRAAYRLYGDNPEVNNNMGAYLLSLGDTTAVHLLLEKAPETAVRDNNLGALYLLRGDLEQAAFLLERAANAGCPQAQENLEELARKRRDMLRRIHVSQHYFGGTSY